MDKFVIHKGLAAPMDRENVDTDAIIPKQFLKSIKKTGYGENLFDAWRYKDIGEPGRDNSRRPLNPDFVLNQPRYQGASILVAGKNFGCGSSREHAPWALLDYGFRAVISAEIADIFCNNALKNGLLPIVLTADEVASLLANPGVELLIDLETNRITQPDGSQLAFQIERFARYCLLNGVDELGFLRSQEPEIARFESTRA